MKSGVKNMEHLDARTFRIDVERILRGAVSSDYAGYILDSENPACETFIEAIQRDVEATSSWENEGIYTDDDIRLAIGRVLMTRLDIQY